MKKKAQVMKIAIIFSVIVIAFVISSLLFSQYKYSEFIKIPNLNVPFVSAGLQYQNVNLVDSTVYNKTSNTCIASRYGMEIKVGNCLAQDIDGRDITQDVTFKWNGNQSRNISWIFVYDNQLESGSISALTNVSETIKEYQNTYVNNYLVDRIISYVNLTQKPSYCDLGNLNNTRFYKVNRTSINNTQYNQTICFSEITVVNSTAFRISGNADILQDTIVYRQRYVDVTDKIQFMGNNLLNDGRSYYKTTDVKFNIGDEIKTKWIYTPKDKAKTGKWHILGYDSQTGLINSINNNEYIYLDPWWNNAFNRRVPINITGGNISLTDFTVMINVTYNASMQTDFDDIRFTNESGVELFYELDYKIDSNFAVFWVRVPVLNSGEKNTTIYMYYENPTAAYGGNGENAWAYDSGIWHFSEGSGTTTKSADGTMNATVTGTPIWNNGVLGSGINTTHQTLYWTVSDNARLSPANYAGATWLIWAKDNGATTNYREIWAKDGSTSREWALTSMASSALDWWFLQAGSATYVSWSSPTGYTSSTAFNMYSYIWNGTQSADTVKGYKNKTSQSLTYAPAGSWIFADTNQPMYFGYQSANTRGFTGAIDEAYMFNKTLNPSEVVRYYENQNISKISFGTEELGLQYPTFTFISQDPSDITATNVANRTITILYNITSTGTLNTSSINLFWLTNGTNNANFSWYINGSIVNAGFTNTGVIKSNSSSVWSFILGDNIYPATYLLNLSIFENSPHSTFNLTTDNYMMKTLVLNMTNNTKYNFLEYSVNNISSGVATLRIYYCNSSYTTGLVATNTNCGLIADTPATQGANHIENSSAHWLSSLAINTTTGTIGEISITPTAYFIFRGRTTGWSMQYVSNIARPDASQTSINAGSTWSNLAGTQDTHIHQFSDDATFRYYVCGNLTTGGLYNCSSSRTDILNQSALPPSPVTFYSPNASTYNRTILINYTSSLSPVGNAITKYNISLFNADDTLNRTLKIDNGVNLSYTFTNTNITSGTFNIHVYSTDSAGLYSLSESEDFNISAIFQTTTTVTTSPVSPIDYGTNSTFSCSNDYSLPTEMWINGENKTLEKGVSLIRSAGTYIINCSANTFDGFLGSSQSVSYLINKLPSPVTISASPSVNENYGVETTVTGSDCPSQLTCSLTRNSVGVSNPDVQTLNAGNYIYNYSTSGNENYSAGSANLTLTINKINPSLAITIFPASTITNGTASIVTGSGCPDINCLLKRNGVTVSNPEGTTLGIGTYIYNYSYLGSTNYNAYSITSTLTVNPIIFAGTNGTINFTSNNLSQSINFQVPYNFVTNAYMNLSGNISLKGISNIDNGTNIIDWNDSTYTGNDVYINFSMTTTSRNLSYIWQMTTDVVPMVIYCYNYSSNSYISLGDASYTVSDVPTLDSKILPSSCDNSKNYSIYIDNKRFGGSNTLMYELSLNGTYNINYGKLNATINNKEILYITNLNNTASKTSNFYSQLNSYLSTCTYIDNYCIVPINFNSTSIGTVNYSDVIFNNDGFIQNTINGTINTTETKNEAFNTSIAFDSSIFTATANLVYDGLSYPATVTTSGYNATINRSINIPVGTGNKTWYFIVGLTNSTGTYYYNTTIQNQTVSLLNMSLCGSPYTTPFINFTFHNETLANERVNATFTGSFTYWLSDASVNKTFSYTSASEKINYQFCFTPSNTNIYLSAIGSYANSYSQERSFSNTSMLINSTLTTKDLLLLPNSDGIYITFIIQNTYNQRIANALIDVKKTSGNVPVEQKYSDGTGIAAFWLSTSTSYTITVSASGYTTSATGITPVSSPVSITLTPVESVTTPTSNTRGVNIKISPKGNELLNNTAYNFTFNISSTPTNLDEYGFSLWNATGLIDAGKSGTNSGGGNLSLTFNTDNQKYIIMKYYYVINGKYSNGTQTWYVTNTDGRDFSLKNMFNNLKDETAENSTGIFGVKRGDSSGNFTFAIIIFLIVFFSAGIMSYKFGITATTGITFVIFSIVLFLDVGVGLFPEVAGSPISNFPTLIMGVVLIGMFIKESMS